MEIHFSAKQIKLTPAIKDYIHEKIGKAQRYFDPIIWSQAFLSVEKRSHNAEFVVHAPGQTFRARSAAADLYSAVDLASDKIDIQLKKFKERLKDRHKHLGREDSPPEEAPSAAPNLKFDRQVVAPLTPREAARSMEAGKRPFFLFQDKDSRQIHVIYKAEDGDYRVVRPVKSGAAGA